MRIATWNLNHRAGSGKWRPEAVDAAIALDADVLVSTEFFQKDQEQAFRSRMAQAGWSEQVRSARASERTIS